MQTVKGDVYGNKAMKLLDKGLILCTAGNEKEKLEQLCASLGKMRFHPNLSALWKKYN